MGWLVGLWVRSHCWNIRNRFLSFIISLLKYQKLISEFSEQYFWNTINCNSIYNVILFGRKWWWMITISGFSSWPRLRTLSHSFTCKKISSSYHYVSLHICLISILLTPEACRVCSLKRELRVSFLWREGLIFLNSPSVPSGRSG